MCVMDVLATLSLDASPDGSVRLIDTAEAGRTGRWLVRGGRGGACLQRVSEGGREEGGAGPVVGGGDRA